MKLNFAKLDPTGNTTILVTSPVPRAEQPRLAGLLMEHSALCAEQVGFLERPTLPGARVRLQMAGGEFCGNASMSLAALLAREDGLSPGAEADYSLEVSGAGGIVSCHISQSGETSFAGSVGMPLPEEITWAALPGGQRFPLVRFVGIAHMVIDEEALSPAEAETIIAGLCAQLDIEALGLLLTNPERTRLRPLVYVRATDSAVWESGCGSGSAALAACTAFQSQQDASLQISQPGGVIAAHARYSGGAIRKLGISGNVRLVAQGEVFVD